MQASEKLSFYLISLMNNQYSSQYNKSPEAKDSQAFPNSLNKQATSKIYTQASGLEKHVVSNTCRSVETVDSYHPSKESTCRSVEAVDLSFDLSEYLPERFSSLLKQVAEAMPTSPEMLLTTLLPTCASLIGTAAFVQPWDGWKEPSIIWAMSIAPTGSMKSPTMDIITNPLWELDNQCDESRDYIVDDFTMEALMQVHQNNPRGLLVHRDELDGLFKSNNKYRGGKGDDSQRWLSLYSGKSVKVNRKGNEGSRLQLKKTAVSITGTIQPRILSHYIQGDNIHSGTSARWLFCIPEMPPAKYTEKKIPNISDDLTDLYSRLDRIPADSLFIFSDEARDYFVKEWNDPIVDRITQESNLAIEAILSKLRGYCARIALVLHCIDELASVCDTDVSRNTVEVSPQISLETIKKAVSLSKFYLQQAEKVHRVEEAQNSIKEVWIILRQLSEERGGWIKARDAGQKTKKVKGADNFRQLFKVMADAGFGETRGKGKNLEWRYIESRTLGITSTLLRNAESVVA
ncbi:MAG: DUF3987 domain-containing protein [Cyanobacteria bacterium J06581_3]